jgi:hypothetical protein
MASDRIRHPPGMRLSDLLGPIDLPAAELDALRLDGAVYRIAEVWRPTDLPETDEARAAALAITLRDRLVADRLTAAWVLGATDLAPSPLQCCVPVDDRGAAGTPNLDVREVRLHDGDLLRMGDLRLTSPLRTAVDLLASDRWNERTKDAVARLVAHEDPAVLRNMLEQPRFSTFRTRRRTRLAALPTADSPSSAATRRSVAAELGDSRW